MFRYAVAALILGAGTASAQSCAYPTPTVNVAEIDTPEEVRAALQGVNEFLLCQRATIPVNEYKKKFPGWDELEHSYYNRAEILLMLLDERQTVPTFAQFRDHTVNSPLPQQMMDFVQYDMLTSAIGFQEYCRAQGMRSCPNDDIIEQQRAKGIDPYEAAAFIARTVRVDPPDPWFALGTVNLQSPDRNVELSKAKKAYAQQKAEVDRTLGNIGAEERRMANWDRTYQGYIVEDRGKLETFVAKADALTLAGKPVPAELLTDIRHTEEDLNRNIRTRDGYIAESSALIEKHKRKLATLEQGVDPAAKELERQRQRVGVAIKRISTDNAVLFVMDAKERADLLLAVAKMTTDIAARQSRAAGFQDQQKAARARLNAAAKDAEAAADTQLTAGYVSIGAQVWVEVQFAALDLALAGASGGPAGLAAEAVRQVGSNYVFGEDYGNGVRGATYYESTGIGRSWQKPDETAGGGDAAGDLADWGPDWLAANLKKEIFNLPFNVAKKFANAYVADAEASASKALVRAYQQAGWAPSKHLVPVLEQAAKSRVAQEEAAKLIAKPLSRAATKAALRGLLKDAGVGVLKEFGKEAYKKALAELIEGGALEDYMIAQMMVAKAVADMQAAGDLYWGNEDEIAMLIGARDALIERLSVEDFAIEKNEAFFAEPGYALRIELLEDLDAALFEARLWLGEAELTRDRAQGDLVWVIPDAVEYGFDAPEFLPLRIEVK